ncbi:alpha/beta hydrolase [Micromonospora andamanensis]|uniref:Esterase n=1 Tax=Micromonospora andamanensis TaxID=1287068 RepID=A0ABQ4HW24_9ACTN|nr:alpha/beta hydrolase [Micromonospora andamanensis]GIJ09850.1 esterase [Micromonospora andamanensis]GIJ38381.1 esterase [Micromonospora andamanensis]
MPLDRILRSLIAWQRADGAPTPLRALSVEQARERYRESAIRPRRRDDADPYPMLSVVDEKIDSSDSTPVGSRVYTPRSDAGRVITYLHGGGWVTGDLDTHDVACRMLAGSLGAVVVSVDYRRAPEFPYPTPLQDAISAARWTSRMFPDRYHVLTGDSAGAQLALGVALDARDNDGPPIAALLLMYPPVDPSLRIAAAGAHTDGYLLSVDDLTWCYEQYVPDPRHRSDPAVDLLHADLTCLPPTVVATAEFDPLQREGELLVEKLRADGVPARHVPGPGLVHGSFLIQDIVPAAAANARQVIQEFDAVLTGARRNTA